MCILYICRARNVCVDRPEGYQADFPQKYARWPSNPKQYAYRNKKKKHSDNYTSATKHIYVRVCRIVYYKADNNGVRVVGKHDRPTTNPVVCVCVCPMTLSLIPKDRTTFKDQSEWFHTTFFPIHTIVHNNNLCLGFRICIMLWSFRRPKM